MPPRARRRLDFDEAEAKQEVEPCTPQHSPSSVAPVSGACGTKEEADERTGERPGLAAASAAASAGDAMLLDMFTNDGSSDGDCGFGSQDAQDEDDGSALAECEGADGDAAAGDGKKNQPPPTGKVCDGCGAGVSDLTFHERNKGKEYRLWGLRNFWGPLCGWCAKMARVRYAHMSKAVLATYLANPENRPAFKIRSVAFVSIRQEGRQHISVEMLESRVAVIEQGAKLARPDSFYSYTGLAEFMAALEKKDGFDPRQLTMVQLHIDGKAAVGVRQLLPEVQDGDAIKTTLDMDPRIRTDRPEDLEALRLVEQAYADLGDNASKDGVSAGSLAPPVPGSSGAAASTFGGASAASPAEKGKSASTGSRASAKGMPTSGRKRKASAVVADEAFQEMAFQYPKSPHTPAVRKMSNKIDSLLMAVTGTEWRGAFKENSLRSNLRLAEETKKNLRSSEFQELIQKGNEQVQEMEVFCRVSQAKKALEKDESTPKFVDFAKALRDLEGVLQLRSTSGLHCELAVLMAKGLFIDKVAQGHLQNAIRELVTAEGLPQKFRQAAESDDALQCGFSTWLENLIEGAAVDAVRQVAVEDAETINYQQLLNFFQTYVQAVRAEPTLADGLKDRADSYLILVQMGIKQETRPSIVSKAMTTLNSYTDNRLSTSRDNYPVGVALKKLAEGIVKRGRWDEQGDIVFDACVQALSVIHGQRVTDFSVPSQVPELLKLQKQCLVKFAEPLCMWSESRLEEKATEVLGAASCLVLASWQVDFVLAESGMSSLSDLLAQVGAISMDEGEQEGLSKNGLVEQVKDAVAATAGERAAHMDTALGQCKDLGRFLESTLKPKLAKINGDHAQKVDRLISNLGAIPLRASLWDASLSSMLLCMELAQHGPLSYTSALPAFRRHMQQAAFRKQEGAAPTGAQGPEPYMATVLALCKRVKYLQQNEYPKHIKRTPMNSPKALDYCVYFALRSSLGQAVLRIHCEQKVQESMASLTLAWDLQSCIVGDKGRLLDYNTNPDELLSMLVRCDPGPLNESVGLHCNFSSPTAPALAALPHLVDTRTAAMVIQQVAQGPLHISCLQAEGGEPLDKAAVLQLATIHANLATIKGLACRVHQTIVLGGLAMDAKRESYDRAQFGLLLSLQEAIKQVHETLASEDVRALDTKNHRLHFTMYWCDQWLDGVKCFAGRACSKFLADLRAQISSVASVLDKNLPRWDTFITESDFNADLADEHIVNHAFRHQFPSHNDTLANLLEDAGECAKALTGKDFGQQPGATATISFAQGINMSVDHYLLVQGGVLAILCYADSGKGQAMARKVLSVNSEEATTKKLPASVRLALERLSEGDVSNLPTRAGQKPKGKNLPKAPKSEVRDHDAPPGVQPGASFGSAPPAPAAHDLHPKPETNTTTDGALTSMGGAAAAFDIDDFF
mmetsp:Transcript_14578/g.29533  ORF Transcript_14578/g.29533 Transcript_14578/m.29533 type:complete len:1421 (-) Transcript_14578:87-4349(-)